MSIKTYDFKQVTLNVGPYIIAEFEAGGLSFKRDEDLFTKKKGAGGEISRSKKTGSAGMVTVRLKQTSKSNTDLNALYILDQTSNGGALPLTIKDNTSDGLIIATENAWIKTLPEIKFVEEEDMFEWVIDCDNCLVNILGYTL